MMKILKIRTWMTPEEAEVLWQLLSQLQESIGEEYGEAITDMHREIQRQQEEKHHCEPEPPPFDDEIPF